MSAKEGFQKAFDKFMENFDRNCRLATVDSWLGKYFVELFDDGCYRTLWSGDIGDSYSSPGILLRIPPLETDEWNDDFASMYYQNGRQKMIEKFQEVISKINF